MCIHSRIGLQQTRRPSLSYQRLLNRAVHPPKLFPFAFVSNAAASALFTCSVLLCSGVLQNPHLLQFVRTQSYQTSGYRSRYFDGCRTRCGMFEDTFAHWVFDVQTVLMPVIDVSQKGRTGLKTTKKQIFVEADKQVIAHFAETKKFLTNLWTVDTSNPLMMWWNSGGLVHLFGTQCNS